MSKPARRQCPHDDTRWCPLYHAAHIPDAGGCDDGVLDSGGCAVTRGMDYTAAVGALRATHPGLVEHIEWREAVERAKAQRARNLRLLGLH